MGIMKRIGLALEGWRRYRRTVSELAALDSRTLADLGITRADIEAVARGRR
jgi:uncharacterized protein YjiS (DUF1127 family)